MPNKNVHTLEDPRSALSGTRQQLQQDIQTTLRTLADQNNQAEHQVAACQERVRQIEQELDHAPNEQHDDTALRQLLVEARIQMDTLEQQVDRIKAGIAAARDRAASLERSGTHNAIPGKTVETSSSTPELEDFISDRRAGVQTAVGKTLRLHAGPSQEAQLLQGSALSTRLTLLEGPITADDYTWWKVRTIDGREGWVAGEELVSHPE